MVACMWRRLGRCACDAKVDGGIRADLLEMRAYCTPKLEVRSQAISEGMGAYNVVFHETILVLALSRI